MDLFQGMSLKPSQSNSNEKNNEESKDVAKNSVSGFSFLGGSSNESKFGENDEVHKPSSGFGFLATSNSAPSPLVEVPAGTSSPSSGFSFLSVGSPAAPEVQAPVPAPSRPLAQAQNQTASNSVAQQLVGLKFDPVTTSTKKQVRKKKTARRVGYARGADGQDDELATPPTMQPRGSASMNASLGSSREASIDIPQSQSIPSPPQQAALKERELTDDTPPAKPAPVPPPTEMNKEGRVSSPGISLYPPSPFSSLNKKMSLSASSQSPEEPSPLKISPSPSIPSLENMSSATAPSPSQEPPKAILPSPTPPAPEPALQNREAETSIMSQLSQVSSNSIRSVEGEETGQKLGRIPSGHKKNFFKKFFGKSKSPKGNITEKNNDENSEVDKESIPCSSEGTSDAVVPQDTENVMSQKERDTGDEVSKEEGLSVGEAAEWSLKERILAFQVSISSLTVQLEEALAHRTKLAVETAALEAEQRELNAKFHEAERRQAALAAAEEFELADNMTSVVAELREHTENTNDRLSITRAELRQSETKAVELKNDQRMELQSLIQHMELFCKEQDRALRAMIIDAQKVLEAESRRLTKEEDRLKMQREYIQKDETNLQEETQQTESAIAAQTQGIEHSRQSLEVSRTQLTNEIEELERTLAEKKSALETVEKELEGCTEEISEIRTKFSRQLSRIQERRQMLNQTKTECENEETQLDSNKKAYEAKTRSIQHDQGQIQSVVDSAKLNIELAKKLDHIFDEQDQWVEELEVKLSENNGSIDTLQNEVEELQKKANLFKEQQNTLEAQMLSSKSQVDDISQRLPQLEQAKKAAAAARNYKEAGAVSKEIKSLVEKQASTLTELEVLEKTLSHCKTERASQARILVEKESEFQKKELEMKLLKFQALKENVVHLKTLKKRVSKEKNSGLKESAVQMLELELQSRYEEGKEIRVTHNLQGPEYYLEEIEVESEPEEEEEEEEEQGIELKEKTDLNDNAHQEPLEQDDADQPEACASELSPEAHDLKHLETGPNAERVDITENNKSQPHDAPSSPSEQPVETIDPKVIQMALEIQKQILDLESQIGEAVEIEDYDTAAALDEKVEELKSQLQDLGVTEEILKDHETLGQVSEPVHDIDDEVLGDDKSSQQANSPGAGESSSICDEELSENQKGRNSDLDKETVHAGSNESQYVPPVSLGEGKAKSPQENSSNNQNEINSTINDDCCENEEMIEPKNLGIDDCTSEDSSRVVLQEKQRHSEEDATINDNRCENEMSEPKILGTDDCTSKDSSRVVLQEKQIHSEEDALSEKSSTTEDMNLHKKAEPVICSNENNGPQIPDGSDGSSREKSDDENLVEECEAMLEQLQTNDDLESS